jgi:2'-5' RNA ligase
VIRCFIAFELPQSAKEGLARIQEAMKRAGGGIGWVKPTGMHLTLNFLGNIKEKQIDELKLAMGESVAGFEPMELVFSEVGAFPNTRNSRVIWVGLAGHTDSLTAIKQRLDQFLQPLGFEPEQRPFKPHLTLGRVKKRINPTLLTKVISETVIVEKEPFTISHLILYESQLFPVGAEYTPLVTVALG